MATSTLAAYNNNSHLAQSAWGNAIVAHKIEMKTITEVPDVIDLYGGTDEFYNKFTDFGEMYTEDLQPCTKCGEQQRNSVDELRINLTTEPLQYFLNETSAFKETETHCRTPGCGNKKLQSVLKINKDDPPLWIVVRNSGSLKGPEDFFDFNKLIHIDGEKYQLGCMVNYDEKRDHFTSIHNVNNQWIFYDGMVKGTKKRFRLPIGGDYLASDINVDHLLYVRCIDGETI